LLTGLLLPAVLTTLPRILGLLAGLLLPTTLLAALIRIVLGLLALVAFFHEELLARFSGFLVLQGPGSARPTT
jgi:hypothetical protein